MDVDYQKTKRQTIHYKVGKMEALLSEKARITKPPITITIFAKAKAIKADGIDVLNFSADEPDFDTPDSIKQAGITAVEKRFTKYTSAGSIPEVKSAIIAKYQDKHNLTYSLFQVLVSNGGKHALQIYYKRF